ncbi:MAG TPA: hypothetical protein VF746_19255 [Longimicrobium sp.]|jgi:hypothetical protein
MLRKTLVPGALAAALALAAAACDQSATAPDEGLSPAEAQALAAEIGAQDAAMLGSFGTPSFSLSPEEAGGALAAAITTTTTFTRTRACPLGGSVTLAGTITDTRDRETRSGSHTFNATRTENACVFQGRRDGVTITVNGNPNTAITASHSVTNGVRGVGTATKKGSFAWSRSTGQSGTCAIDLVSTWDPATHTYTLKGTFCNQTVDVTRTWTD